MKALSIVWPGKFFFGFFLIFFLAAGIQSAFATHIRAGDISAETISGLRYRFTARLYRDTREASAQRSEFKVGGVSYMVDPEKTEMPVPDNPSTAVVLYIFEHTFASPGIFKVSFRSENRKSGIRNMDNSINTAFFIESEFVVNPVLGINHSPIMLLPPVDLANKGVKYFHNPAAYDQDGDSLAYKLVKCRKDVNTLTDNYLFPDNPKFSGFKEDGSGRPATFTMDPRTGNVEWDAPGMVGEFNFAFIVEEYRDGLLIGLINRDMQIIVQDTRNTRPKLEMPKDTCIVAGNLLKTLVQAHDEDGDSVRIYHFGGVFDLKNPSNKASFTLQAAPLSKPKGLFSWQTVCNDVQKEPYSIIFKAEDRPNPSVNKLSTIETWRVKVVGPPPFINDIKPDKLKRSIRLQWNPYTCSNAEKMTVWRRKGSFNAKIDTCQTGIPAGGGYEMVGEVPINTVFFVDDNAGKGLEKGFTYCYRIYAVFPSPRYGESLSSAELCSEIPSDAPFIVKISVSKTDAAQGSIDLAWTKPLRLSGATFDKPYTYKLYRGKGMIGKITDMTEVAQVFGENDTTFRDTGLDTEKSAYRYALAFLSKGVPVDTSSISSSVFTTAMPQAQSIKLSWAYDVAWQNKSTAFPKHYIYREDLAAPGNFKLIDSVDVVKKGSVYTDTKYEGKPLDDKKKYCYKIETFGTYSKIGIASPLRNFSQIVCAVPLDTIKPCPPVLSINPLDCRVFNNNQKLFCDSLSFTNILNWKNQIDPKCQNDIVSYKLYVADSEKGEFKLIKTLPDTLFFHKNLPSYAGCYAVTAVDGSGNESGFSNIVCKDNCPYYELPNVFTPNKDRINDLFVPKDCPRFVEKVEFSVYNRWGKKVFFSDNDIKLNWGGTLQNGDKLSLGTYYYEAKVHFYSVIPANREKTLKGWIYILGE